MYEVYNQNCWDLTNKSPTVESKRGGRKFDSINLYKRQRLSPDDISCVCEHQVACLVLLGADPRHQVPTLGQGPLVEEPRSLVYILGKK